MKKRFKIKDAIKVLPKTDFSNETEKYDFIADELDVAIEKAVRDGQLNLKNGSFRIQTSPNSSLSCMNAEMALKYFNESGFKVKTENILILTIKVPTFLYSIFFKSTNSISDESVDLIYTIEGKTKTIKNIGIVNKANFFSLNLNEIFEKKQLHITEVSDIKIKVLNQEFEFNIEDTDNKQVELTFEIYEEDASTN